MAGTQGSYKHGSNPSSTAAFSQLLQTSSKNFGNQSSNHTGTATHSNFQSKKWHSSASLATIVKQSFKRYSGIKPHVERINKQIIDVRLRKKYIMRLTRAFMLYGAPTHRLGKMMMAASRALKLDTQFIYLPNCMIITFDDFETETSEMQFGQSRPRN